MINIIKETFLSFENYVLKTNFINMLFFVKLGDLEQFKRIVSINCHFNQ